MLRPEDVPIQGNFNTLHCEGVAIDKVIKMANDITRAWPIGRKYIAVFGHYRHIVLDQQSYLALIHVVLHAPVATGMFDELHKLNTMAWELEQSWLHPTCNQDTRQRINEALGAFNEGQSLFINQDTSFNKLQTAFSKVKELIDVHFHHYNFIQQVIQESQNSPAISSMVEASDFNQNWAYGFVTGAIIQTPNQMCTQVTLMKGISAYEVVFEAAPWLLLTVLKFISSPVSVIANLGGHLEGSQSNRLCKACKVISLDGPFLVRVKTGNRKSS
ncbi:hypothetical protein BJV74DRAFT_799299 [Russula compacta]|nr:hypothetical protein BJV74DRAFT_799299 [Russula compacta]